MDLEQISKLVGQQVKSVDEKFKSADWSVFKKVPSCFRQKQKLSTTTVDEDFLAQESKFIEYENALRSFSGCLILVRNGTQSLMATSCLIADAFGKLLEPDPLSEDYQHQFQRWQNTNFYAKEISFQKTSVSQEYETLDQVCLANLSKSLSICESIKNQIKRRKKYLQEHDGIFSKHEKFIMIQTTRSLSDKEKVQLSSLERKLQASKSKYEKLNNLLKNELAVFFQLVEEMIQTMQGIIFCITWMVSYKSTNDSLDEIFPGEISSLEREIEKPNSNPLRFES